MLFSEYPSSILKIYTVAELEKLIELRPDLKLEDVPSIEDIQLLDPPTFDQIVIQFLEQFDVFVQPTDVGKWNGWDTIAVLSALLVSRDNYQPISLAGPLLAANRSRDVSNAAFHAAQEWTTWKQWALGHKDFESFKEQSLLLVEKNNEELINNQKLTIKKVKDMNEYRIDALKSSFIRDSYFPNYKKLYPDCSENFIRLLKKYDGSLKEIGGEGVSKRYLKSEYTFPNVKTPKFKVLSFLVYFIGSFLLVPFWASFSENLFVLILLLLVFILITFIFLEVGRGQYIEAKFKKRRRLKTRPYYKELYPNCSENFITLLEKYDGSLKEIGGEGVSKRYLKSQYLFPNVKTPKFKVISFLVYFIGSFLLGLFWASFSESLFVLILLFLVFLLIAFIFLEGGRGQYIEAKFKKRRRLKGKL